VASMIMTPIRRVVRRTPFAVAFGFLFYDTNESFSPYTLKDMELTGVLIAD
jgi:hypothetical protein